MSVALGLALLFIIFAVAIMVFLALGESDKWLRTNDPTVIELIEKYENLDENSRQVIRDIADDG